MTVVVVEPSTIFLPRKPPLLSQRRISYLVAYPAAFAGGSQFSVTEGLCGSTAAVRFETGSGVRAVAM